MAEPWIKVSTSIISNPKVMGLTGDAFKAWVCILAATKLYGDGALLPPVKRLAFALHVNQDVLGGHLLALTRAGLLEQTDGGIAIHDWDAWQRLYPSESKDARAERQRRSRLSRGVTTGHDNGFVGHTGHESHEMSQDVTTGHESHALEESRVDKFRGEEINPPLIVPPLPVRASRTARTARGTRIPADLPLSEEIVAHADSLGIDHSALVLWHENYHDYWSQRAANATSLDWLKHEKTRLSADVREGRLVPSGVSMAPEQKNRRTPLSRAEVPVVPAAVAGVPELTPAEESYQEAMKVLTAEAAPEEAGEMAQAVIAVFGGWEAFLERAPPKFPEWVAAWHRTQSGFPGGSP
jgi:hypothetical protein